MQTFLPYPDFKKSAQVLDRQRLGKQRVEALQILQTLNRGSRWSNHPAVKMWRGHEQALVYYGLYVCNEWIRRGYKDSCYMKILSFSKSASGFYEMPSWFGNEEFHRAHRSNLLRKDKNYYSKYFNEPEDLPYLWPEK